MKNKKRMLLAAILTIALAATSIVAYAYTTNENTATSDCKTGTICNCCK